jgi:hypothetical protein
MMTTKGFVKQETRQPAPLRRFTEPRSRDRRRYQLPKCQQTLVESAAASCNLAGAERIVEYYTTTACVWRCDPSRRKAYRNEMIPAVWLTRDRPASFAHERVFTLRLSGLADVWQFDREARHFRRRPCSPAAYARRVERRIR